MEQDAYREAGVDIDLEAAAVKSLISELTYRRKGEFSMASEIGHFAGFVSLGKYVLAMAVDGVGTKCWSLMHCRTGLRWVLTVLQ
jgi:Phosphoribosylaminoimidazole (AIR) synthetase